MKRNGRGLGLAAAVLACLALAPAADTRAARIGNQLICPCGCTQGALVCNHVGCPVVTKLREEIAQRAQSSDSDELVLQSFTQEYGTQVRAVPPARGFNLLVWVMPWIAAAFGLLVVFTVIRRWSDRQAPAAVAETALGRQAQADLERELKG